MSMYQGVMYAAAPPPGVTPDPDEPHQATALVVVTGIFLPLAVISMAIRMYTRAAIVRKVAFDDYLMFAATILNIGMCILVLQMLNFGLGKHLWNVPLSDLYPRWMLNNVIAAILFCLATGLAKGSILLFYLRIFPSKPMRLAIWAVFAFTIGYSAASALVNVFSCRPIQGSWRLEDSATAVCINRPAFYFAQAAFGIATDIATVLLPLPMLRSLHLPLKQKVGVSLVLTMGAFVCVVSIIRLQSLYTLLSDADLTINTVNALMWVILELNLSIVGGCIPALKPFAQRHCPILLGSSRGASTNGLSNPYYAHSKSGTGKKPSTNRTRDSGYPTSDHFRSRASAAAAETDSIPGTGSEECIVMQDKITKTVQYGYAVESMDDDVEAARGRAR
ncbi:hypothetical protein PG993_003898 [Apiospora rasikravindrae]|uniref:Rhodopsin domain-containing protein n=1 Tax=Apiospora rasikravindrae TaxID=990691 RepID=A0ABR1U0U7_9PEZI